MQYATFFYHPQELIISSARCLLNENIYPVLPFESVKNVGYQFSVCYTGASTSLCRASELGYATYDFTNGSYNSKISGILLYSW